MCQDLSHLPNAPVELSWSVVLITPLLERRFVCLTLLITSVLNFRFGSCPLDGGRTGGSVPCLFRKNLL